MSKDEIEIYFESKEKSEPFSTLYSGNSVSYHDNYEGQLRYDRSLGTNNCYVKLDRSKVKDFERLGQDIAALGGKIVG